LPAVLLEGPGDPVPKAFGIEKTGFSPQRVAEVTRLFSSANPLGRARERRIIIGIVVFRQPLCTSTVREFTDTSD